MTSDSVRAALLERDFKLALLLMQIRKQSLLCDLSFATGNGSRQTLLDAAKAQCEQDLYLAYVIRAQIGSELHLNATSLLYSDSHSEQPSWRVSA